MKKRCIGLLLALVMIAAILPVSAAHAASLPAAPNLNISYQQSGVSAGTIRYVSQLRASGYFCLPYWQPFEDAAGHECYTASISMALSGLGLDATPAALGTYWNQRGHTGGSPFATVAWDVGAFGASYLERPFAKAMQAFVADPGTYSAPIIHLTTYSQNGHYVMMAGQVNATTFLVVDPASDAPWTLKIENNVVEYLRKGEMLSEELEPAVTELMKSFESDTVHLEGLEFRIKSKSSLMEKIARKVHEKGIEVEEAAAGIADVLRYTMIINDDEYVATTKNVLDSFVEQGYSVAEFENHWADVDYDYQGINTKLRSPEGFLIELQFHTPDSYDTKQEKTHKYYEIIRSEDATEEEKAEAARIQHELFAQVPVPEGVMEFTYET
jgi:hypothetical protein